MLAADDCVDGSRPLGVIGTTHEGADDGRRRRRRRHLHRPVPLRRRRQALPHRQGAVAARRRGARASSRAARARQRSRRIASIVHGTTVGTNALLERKRRRSIGVITTRGFRDVLEMRRRDRRSTWGLWGDFAPIADRDLRLEVDERTLADGDDPRRGRSGGGAGRGEDAPRARAREALAIIFINAYANAENERRALAAAARGLAERVLSPPRTRCCPRSASSSAPRPTALNAYLQPVVGDLSRQARRRRWRRQSFAGSFHIVQSNGGVMSTATARRLAGAHRAVGPGGRRHRGGRASRAPPASTNVITCDLGGTSFDVSLIATARPRSPRRPRSISAS